MTPDHTPLPGKMPEGLIRDIALSEARKVANIIALMEGSEDDLSLVVGDRVDLFEAFLTRIGAPKDTMPIAVEYYRDFLLSETKRVSSTISTLRGNA